jgi:SEL1 protein
MAINYILKSIPTGPVKAPTQTSSSKTLSGPLSTAVGLLEKSAHLNNTDALLMLAEFNFYGNHSHPRHLDAAYDYYKRLARTHGNSTAQYMVALYHSTGIGDVVPRDQATALLYYYFAAMQGDMRAQMATASRYYAGIGTPKNCEAAAKLYKRVADKAITWYRQGPPGNRAWIQQSWKLPDEHGGIYGEGASVSSAGVNAYRPSPNSDAHAAVGDVIEYLEVVSQRGDSKATLELGRRYYEGQRGLDQDLDMARKYFFLLSSRLWKRDGTKVDGYKPGIEKSASRAAGYIGWMFLRGEGLKQNFPRAKEWFERGRQYGDAQSQYGLGLMLLNGYGGKTNVKLAMELFKAASDQDFAPAQVQMGRLYLDQGGPEDLRIANNYFELAARHGNIEAHYYIAEMIYNGVGRERHCSMAMNYYKSVAEKAEPLLSSWADANDAFEAGETELAFLEYLVTAEQGYEKAQTNIAYMLDNVPSRLSISSWLGSKKVESSLFENPSLALIYWTRSSRQSNVDSLVKMGDYYFYGIGTEPDLSKAVQCYTGASDYSQSAQALFNLGWMHENGIGLTQDFHLAKRYYDHALEVNVEAYLPVTLSLMKLRLRSAWNTLTHGSVHSIQEEPRKLS